MVQADAEVRQEIEEKTESIKSLEGRVQMLMQQSGQDAIEHELMVSQLQNQIIELQQETKEYEDKVNFVQAALEEAHEELEQAREEGQGDGEFDIHGVGRAIREPRRRDLLQAMPDEERHDGDWAHGQLARTAEKSVDDERNRRTVEPVDRVHVGNKRIGYALRHQEGRSRASCEDVAVQVVAPAARTASKIFGQPPDFVK